MTEQNRIAIVTGTSAGIGAALAEALLQAGWVVLGLARREVDFRRADYRHHCVDLSDTAGLPGFCEKQVAPVIAEHAWRQVALVNNAARLGALCEMAAMTAPDLANVMAVNTVAPMCLMGFVARTVLETTPLRVVNISSGAAKMGIPGLADYCASKAALRLAGMALASEFAQQKRQAAVFSYEPGMVATNMQVTARASDPDAFPSHGTFQAAAARGELAAPSEVVSEVVSYLDRPAPDYFLESRFGVD